MLTVISDVHLSYRPPIARANEPDWLKAQFKHIHEVLQFAHDHNSPLVIAGDVFHHWNQPPEVLVELARCLRKYRVKVFAIPGQHDIPNHDFDQIHRSAFQACVEANLLSTNFTALSSKVGQAIIPFPWKADLVGAEQSNSIAIVHKYIWRKNATYPGAPPENHCRRISKELQGFTYAFFGDNHIPFAFSNEGGLRVHNCGAFISRSLAERDNLNYYYALEDGGRVTAYPSIYSKAGTWSELHQSIDKAEHSVASIDFAEMTKALSRLDADVDLQTTFNRYFDEENVPDPVRKLIMEGFLK